jgi:predicted metalloprotease with PDZ domain
MKKWMILFCSYFLITGIAVAQPQMRYTVNMPQAAKGKFHITLDAAGFNKDSIVLKMPNWMPGYYQLMNYANTVDSFVAHSPNGTALKVNKINSNTWVVLNKKNSPFRVTYQIQTKRKFVANSFIDSAHAYIVPANNFFYVAGMLQQPVQVTVNSADQPRFKKIATGLEMVKGKTNAFTAPNFDILYDCPILVGDLKALPTFTVRGVPHRFIGYNMGSFDEQLFMSTLQKAIEQGVNIIDHIPFKEYTFIGIGPGRGGIEHLNNTTVSFSGNELKTPADINRIMNFLSHEYFHHYNVKRIRPVELGPFDYDKGSKTTQLWISEGLSVYFEYLMVKRAKIVDRETFLSNLANNITAHENNPGKAHQSLLQASYNTWSDGPFGTSGLDKNKAISYYDKGPVVGMLLDLAIRNASNNQFSLDHVMRLMYQEYYQRLQRGFTDAEFQAACEQMAGQSLANEFEFISTTKQLDYQKYLGYAGLTLTSTEIEKGGQKKLQYKISPLPSFTADQLAMLNSWLGD